MTKYLNLLEYFLYVNDYAYSAINVTGTLIKKVYLHRNQAVIASVITSVPLRITFVRKNREMSNSFFNPDFMLKVLLCAVLEW